VGISAEQQQKLFRPFEQADSSTTRRFGGTGLGLAISARIVQLMGGEIRIDSRLGAGSTFHFTLPLVRPAELPASMADQGSEALSDARILIVDDNETNRNTLLETTSHWQMPTTLADSGTAGLERLNRAARAGRPFRLLLVDEDMPGMNGVELVAQMLAGPAAACGVIMMLSSSDRSASAAQCRELGLTTLLTKPVRRAELLVAIQKELGVIDLKRTVKAPAPVFDRAQNSLRILVAEDNLVNQKLALAMLGKMGHQVTLANNGVEAIALSGNGEFDLILMDVQMPELDGFEATRQIRRRELGSARHIPIVAMTANAMEGDRERCIASGMDDYISKPISSQSLADAIFRLVLCSQ
jgi:CheY-like chemotaxis protein